MHCELVYLADIPRNSALCQPVLGERAGGAGLREPTVHGEPRKRGCAVVRTRSAQRWARCFREGFLGPLTPDDSLGGNDILTSAHIRVFFSNLFVLSCQQRFPGLAIT